MNQKELNLLKSEVEPVINKLNKIIIMNDMSIEDMRVMSEIGLTAKSISEIFQKHNQIFLSESYNAIDLMINTTMFGGIGYHTAISYVLHLNESLSETVEILFVSGEISCDLQKRITDYKKMLFDWVDREEKTPEKKAEYEEEIKSISLKIPENIEELNGRFTNLNNIEFIDDFISETSEFIENTEKSLLELETNINSKDLINRIFRYIHSIKGTSGFFMLNEITVVSHWSETLLDKCRNDEIKVTEEIVDILLKAVDVLKSLLQNVCLRKNKIQNKNEKIQIFSIDINNILELLKKCIEQKPISRLQIQKEENKTQSLDISSKADNNILQDSIRIPVGKIDTVNDMVGELLISMSLLKQTIISNYIEDKDLMNKINYLDMISDQLQKKILKMRMFPIKTVYEKLKRQVRDLINKSNKEVEFKVAGGETEVDKVIIDEIFSPLTHIIRNSMDHGIEVQADRIQKGKKECAEIQLKTENCGDNVIIEIYDDGSGLDKEKILAKANEQNLIDKENNLTDNEIYNLIFHPGFSTAKKVTEISGRGVGMDVVKKTIQKLSGKISIETEPDKYTKFIITLPVSTSIIEGLIVKSDNKKYVFPVLKIKHTLNVKTTKIETAFDSKTPFIIYDKKTTQLIKLSDYYNGKKCNEIKQGVILIIEYENRYYGIVIDEIVSKEKLVSKNLGERFSNVTGLKGGTILGDGSVGFIIEPEEIVRNGELRIEN